MSTTPTFKAIRQALGHLDDELHTHGIDRTQTQARLLSLIATAAGAITARGRGLPSIVGRSLALAEKHTQGGDLEQARLMILEALRLAEFAEALAAGSDAPPHQ